MNSIPSIPIPEVHPGLRAPGSKKARPTPLTTVSAVLSSPVTLESQADGKIVACFEGLSVSLGMFSAGAADRARDLHKGLPLASFSSGRRPTDKELDLLVRRLARHGLLMYRVGRSRQDSQEQAVIEPQTADYWPQEQQLGDADVLVLSRFAYLRRRGNEMVLESPRAGALFKISSPKVAAVIAMLAEPCPIRKLRRQDGFPGIGLLGLLADSQILFKIAAGDSGLRTAEGDGDLVLWDFHDLLFHTRSTAGRHANPLGGLYRYADVTPPLPAVRSRWPGKSIDLRKFSTASSERMASQIGRLLRERHSTRIFDDSNPITLLELSQFLDRTARVLSVSKTAGDLSDGDLSGSGPASEIAARPYPSAGSSYELELYLAVDKCEGLARGFYHYDAGGHALVPIDARPQELEALLGEAEFAMGVAAAPQVLITIAARFGRVSWKYSSIAYALILKDVGVLIQTLYLIATDMRLGGCATGIANIDLFARMTGIEFHVEGPVGQFAVGRSEAWDGQIDDGEQARQPSG